MGTKIDLLKATFPGCGRGIDPERPRRKCRFHISTPIREACFGGKAELLRRVSPMAEDAPDFIREDTDFVAFTILRLSLDAHWERGDLPPEPPERFEREWRTHETWTAHYGWTPVWANGERREGWSYTKGLMERPELASFINAARQEIAEQMFEIRYGCGIEGAHVHHAAPWTFQRLIRAFLAKCSMTPEDVRLADDGFATRFADPDLGADWRDFHAVNAELIALTPEQHNEAHRNEKAGFRWDGSAPLEAE